MLLKHRFYGGIAIHVEKRDGYVRYPVENDNELKEIEKLIDIKKRSNQL